MSISLESQKKFGVKHTIESDTQTSESRIEIFYATQEIQTDNKTPQVQNKIDNITKTDKYTQYESESMPIEKSRSSMRNSIC